MRMKQISMCLFGLTSILLSFSACNSKPDLKVPNEIEYALYDKYGGNDIRSLEWSLVDEYYVGEFRMNGFYCRAWLNSEGNWLMTETMDIIYEDLPKEIKNHFESAGNGKAKESYKVEFANVETRYLLEAKNSFYFYRGNGDLFKKVDGGWANRPIVIDKEILRYIKANCDPVSSIIDANIKATPIQVDICEGKSKEERYKTICFDTPDLIWLTTFWKIVSDEVPSKVYDSMKKIVDESDIESRYRIKHQLIESAYGFKLKSGKIVFFDDEGKRVEITDIPLD